MEHDCFVEHAYWNIPKQGGMTECSPWHMQENTRRNRKLHNWLYKTENQKYKLRGQLDHLTCPSTWLVWKSLKPTSQVDNK